MASTIKVDNVQNQPGTNIINKCSTTVTLGASGDNIALASGATQTGFGRTGTVDWITTPKVTGDSPITGVTGKGYFLNTTAGTITLNLPAGAAGSIVSVADYAGTWQTNAVTVAANGTEKIGGVASAPVSLTTEGQSVTLVYVDSTQGWINTMDSTSNVRGSEFMSATVSGACNTLTTAPDCANVKVAKFVGPGTFCVSSTGVCAANNLVSYIVVAGGGGGASTQGSWGGGGGGAGGYRELVSPTSPYTGSPLDGYATPANRITVSISGYPITVGGGGPGGPACGSGSPGVGGNGNNSIFSCITSTGGGGGGAGHPGARNQAAAAGQPGGSGGGATSQYCASPSGTASGGVGNTPPVTPSQGNPGGTAAPHPPARDSGGGGGAAAAGGNSSGGPGGNGVPTQITGSAVYYAGGAGGGGVPPGTVGCGSPAGGGGGNGATPGQAATTGTVNTGGGGGGGAASPIVGQAGGSGIVIIRYKFQ